MFEDKISALNQNTESIVSTAPEKRTYRVDEIQDILEIGRNAAYALVKEGVFRSVRVGGNIRISKKSFDSWLDNQDDDLQL